MAKPVAILASMEQESHLIESGLTAAVEHLRSGRRYVTGELGGVPIVTAVSGYGKVAAAATVASVLEVFTPSLVVFGGVAGGVGDGVEIGDIVVADRLTQHDFDASPLFQRFVVPSLGVAQIAADPELTARLETAAHTFVAGGFQSKVQIADSALFDPARTKVHRGLVASGDRFIDNVAEARVLLGDLPDCLAVEMEGAAVAQVCAERRIPFGVFRSISDRADQDADVDFMAFIRSVAAPITVGVVEELLSNLS